MRYLTITALVACLVACATQQLNTGLQRVVGQPIDVLVADWGYPGDQREIMGHTLYIWSNNNGAMAVPMYGGGVYAAQLTCTVQVAVNDQKIITSYQWSGNNGGCAAFARRIAH
jgi:hypothetical protein